LDYHKKAVHQEIYGPRLTFDCKNCQKPLRSQTSLNKHLERFPNGQCPIIRWRCPLCNCGFALETSLDRHLKEYCKKPSKYQFVKEAKENWTKKVSKKSNPINKAK
jgi:hypothetical protein